jgi:hypothetical protein
MTNRSHALPSLGELVPTDEGVTVERRSFLGLAAAGFLAPRSPRMVLPREGQEPHLTLEEFLEEVLPVARELKSALGARPQRSLEDRYLHALAAHACRLGDVAPPELRPSSQGKGVSIGASWAGDPFVVLHWRMAPEATIRLHAHTYGNVCTVGLEGEAHVRNFETVDPLDVTEEGPVMVRRTTEQHLDVHGINLVPLSHGFCHGFSAGPAGARGLDITTRLAERKPTPYLVLDDEPVDVDAGLYRGRWELE